MPSDNLIQNVSTRGLLENIKFEEGHWKKINSLYHLI